MKKIISVLLALSMMFALCATGFASDATAEKKALQFNEDGKFTILHITDCQDIYPASEAMYTFIYKVLEDYKPDLVVLGGDNTVAEEEDKEAAVEELVKPYVDTGTYFTLVFGNHDYQQGWNNAELFALYEKYGGEYFLGTDELDSLNNADKIANNNLKAGTQFLPVYASDGSGKAAFGIYMFDSGSYVFDEDGNELGYGSVEPYQIDWYKSVRDSYVDEDGNYLPSVAFQHIVCGDVYDYLYYPSAIDLGAVGSSYYGKYYTVIPKCQNFSGFLNEPPCPGVYNYGQLDAMAEKGDVKAVFSGHDHVNAYDVEIKGVHVINTPGVTYYSYSSELSHGCRVVTLDEDTGTYSTDVITINSYSAADASFASAVGTNQTTAGLYEFLASFLLKAEKFFAIFGKAIDLIAG